MDGDYATIAGSKGMAATIWRHLCVTCAAVQRGTRLQLASLLCGASLLVASCKVWMGRNGKYEITKCLVLKQIGNK